jgi:hypothetical protein
MLDERLSLNEAADLLGRSSRQLRRDVQAGRLHAQGGGRGKALWFKASDLKDFQGCFDADLLARAVFGLHRLRLGDKPADVFPRHESQMLWRWWRDGSPAFKFARERFPALESVPDGIRQGVRGICAKLSPREVDYLAGMVVVTAHPWSVFSPEELHAIKLAQDALFMSRRLRYRANQSGYATALDEALFPPVQDRAEWLDAVLFGDGKAIRDAYRMQGVHRLSIVHGRVVGAGDKVPSPIRWVRALRVVLNPASGPDLRSTFMQAARKISLDFEQVGKGRPDAYRVAALLGIERHLASKIFFVGIAPKLGPDATGDWFKLLGSKPPRVRGAGLRRLGARITSTQDESVCKCGGALGAWDAFCPECGAPVIERRVGGKKRSTASASDHAHLPQADD